MILPDWEIRLAKAVLLGIVATVLILLTMGCYSESATRRADPAAQYENALTLEELVCRHVSVTCYGNQVLVRHKKPIWYLDGMRAGMTLIGHVHVRDVAAIDVCTRASCLAHYPNAGSRYVIHIHTKKGG